MEMLEILKGRLPEGLEIKKVKIRSGRAEITFLYDGTETLGWLRDTCAPGHAENICDFTIAAAMMGIALTRGDFEMAKFWRDKQNDLSAPLV